MPKSRGRKPKPGKRARIDRREPSRYGYQPSRFTVDYQQGIEGLLNLPPEVLLEIGLPVSWLMLVQGTPANVCLDGALILRAAYAQFGITAEPKLVVLTVHDPATGQTAQYGTTTPRIEGPHLVGGHMGLWLPASGRFVDHSIQQFPQIRAESWLPVVARVTSAAIPAWGQAQLGLARGRLFLTYSPLPEKDNVAVLKHPRLTGPAITHYRAGVNVASNFLQVLRIDDLRAMAAPHPRLHALLDAVGDAELVRDEQDCARFLMPGTGDRGGVYLDEIVAGVRDPGE